MPAKLLKNPLALGAILACGLATASVSAPASTSSASPAVDPGKAIVDRACQSCHDLGMATGARRTAKEWTSVVQRMRANGADLSDDDAKQVQAYLAKVYGKPG